VRTTYKPAFAIVRLDHFLFRGELRRECVTVKKVVMTQEEAEREVERLNKIGGGWSVYFWQYTRLVTEE
jgi:hypothetical protein